MNAINRTLEAYGVPEADIELLTRMQAGSWYSVMNSFGETAACAIEKGMKQGDPPSPAKYVTFKDPLLRMLSASGCGWSPPTREPIQRATREARRTTKMTGATESHPAPTFVDDLVLVVLGLRAVAEALALIAIIEAWETWAGVYVNLAKSCCAAFDYGTNTRVPTCDVTYRGVPLPEQAPHEPIRYLGMLLTLTHDYKFEKDRVRQATKERVEVLDRATFLSPSQREMVVQLAIVSVFR